MLLLETCICSCKQEKTESPTFDKNKIAEEVRQVNNSIYHAGNEKDAAKLFSYFSDSVTGVFDGSVMGSWEDHKFFLSIASPANITAVENTNRNISFVTR